MISRLYRSFRSAVARQLGIRGLLDRLQAIEAKCDRIENKVAVPIVTAPSALTQEARDQFRREWQDEQNLKLEHARTTGVVSGIRQSILVASSDSWFRVNLNGTECLLPRSTLVTMVHCIHCPPNPQVPIPLNVEAHHSEWMFRHTTPGCIFLDVGAATGAVSVPGAFRHEGNMHLIAFEPARNPNRILRDTLTRNRIKNVEVIEQAVSDQCGEVEFTEYEIDESGNCPFRSEASTITAAGTSADHATRYPVKVTTLDTFFAGRSDRERVKVMKIDVEGFEVHVLRGAKDFLQVVRPWISIDIHKNPFGAGDTEAPVREVLAPYGYSFQKEGHVLLCTPPNA